MYTKDTIFKEFNEETRKLSKGIDWEDYPFKVLNIIIIIIKKKTIYLVLWLKTNKISMKLQIFMYICNKYFMFDLMTIFYRR